MTVDIKIWANIVLSKNVEIFNARTLLIVLAWDYKIIIVVREYVRIVHIKIAIYNASMDNALLTNLFVLVDNVITSSVRIVTKIKNQIKIQEVVEVVEVEAVEAVEVAVRNHIVKLILTVSADNFVTKDLVLVYAVRILNVKE